MSDEKRDRTISGLAPVARPRPSAAALVKANRTLAADSTDQTSRPPALVVGLEQGEASQPEISQRTKGRSAGRRSQATGKVPMGVDVPEGTRDRARGAFRVAAYFEGVSTFSDFVTNALEAEIRRIELAHNSGQPIEPRRENLPPGRRGR